jgi:protein-disulfide isomerase
MFTKLGSVTLIALLSLSPPQDQNAEIAALKRQVQELRDQQQQMQRDLTAIKDFLQKLLQGAKQQADGPEIPGLVGAMFPTAGEPAMGSPSARVMLIEISDYQCPFCKRQVQQTFPQLQAEYVKAGKVQYVFSHEAAACAGDQGKFWEMHMSLFNGPIAKDDGMLTKQAQAAGLDMAQFNACLSSGRHSAAIKDSVARIERLGIGGTPMTLLGYTPAPGQPMKVEKYLYGALPYAEFKAAIDALLKS